MCIVQIKHSYIVKQLKLLFKQIIYEGVPRHPRAPARPLCKFPYKPKSSAKKQPPHQLANLLLGDAKTDKQQRKLIFACFTAVFS